MIFSDFARAIIKAAGHRYYKRVPYMTPKGKRYRYFYRVTSTHRGRHAFDEAHLVEGTAFALHGEGESEFHGHITKVDGDQITYVIDDGPRKGEEVPTTRAKLVAELNEVHGVQDKLSAEREKVRAAIAEAQRAGHGGVVRRLERRLRALGGESEARSSSLSGVTDASGAVMTQRALQDQLVEIVEAESKDKRLNVVDVHRALHERGISIRPGQLKDVLTSASSANAVSLRPWTRGLDQVEFPEYLISRNQGNMMYHVEPARGGEKRDLPDTPAVVRSDDRQLSLEETSREVLRRLSASATSIKDLEERLRGDGVMIDTGHLHDHLNLLRERGVVEYIEDRSHTTNPDATSSLFGRDARGVTRAYSGVKLRSQP